MSDRTAGARSASLEKAERCMSSRLAAPPHQLRIFLGPHLRWRRRRARPTARPCRVRAAPPSARRVVHGRSADRGDAPLFSLPTDLPLRHLGLVSGRIRPLNQHIIRGALASPMPRASACPHARFAPTTIRKRGLARSDGVVAGCQPAGRHSRWHIYRRCPGTEGCLYTGCPSRQRCERR